MKRRKLSKRGSRRLFRRTSRSRRRNFKRVGRGGFRI
uniref:Uncharacterized protein n=1 Tax=Microviridae sp. ctXu97 TaxID=2825000 RepID=A0A8S5V9M0_9VIRU|nr:MAG TPA: hypothetical protein [Microviridae sp. ctXu97]